MGRGAGAQDGRGLVGSASIRIWGATPRPRRPCNCRARPCNCRARLVLSAVVNRNQFGAKLPWWSDYVPLLSPPQRPRFTAQDFRQRGLEQPYPATGQPPPAFTPSL